MPTTVLRRKASPQQVLADLAGFSNAQLARLMPAMLALRVQRGRHVLPKREAELLEEINRPLPGGFQAEYDRLVEQRREETLTAPEARQLQRLVEKVELQAARRLRCLVELAGLRQTTVDELMENLGLKAPTHV